ncbi:hypothetical protein [Vibrio mediterranei]|nr:hypothetical protein [Vibrio mediterranei]
MSALRQPVRGEALCANSTAIKHEIPSFLVGTACEASSLAKYG